MPLARYLATVVLTGAALNMGGCAPPAADSQNDKSGTHSAHDHSHGPTGPNQGHLIELGNEEYHAEWLHDDDSGAVTVIILDSTATQEVPISAADVKINVVVDGKPQQYTLDAVEVVEGKSSRFRTVAEDLVIALNFGEGVEATLEVEINGTSFNGEIEHHHHHHH